MIKSKSVLTAIFSGLILCLSAAPAALADQEIQIFENFKGRVLLEGLDDPWGLVWGPDQKLWLTERTGKRITAVDPKTGERSTLATIDEVLVDAHHQGLLGLALAPDFETSGLVYVNYTHIDGQQPKHKIVRLKYDPKAKTLGAPETIFKGLPAGDDHQGGRLIFGPDGMLYLSKGELGHNQGANRCKLNEAQRLPTEAEVKAGDWSAYVGKVLRLTPDGGIPGDNPVINNVRSHVFTYGHRNPQGLAFVDDQLFEVEHGPSSDDELNHLIAGGNYGWPNVAGFIDDQAYAYINWSAVENCPKIADDIYLPDSVPQMKESDFKAPDFQPPLKTFFTVPTGYSFKDPHFGDLAYLGYATIAPSSLTYYPAEGPVKAWRNSFLITTLKNGAIYQVPLSGDKLHAQGDVVKLFHTQNRYRQLLLSPDLRTVYVVTDKAGNVVDLDRNPVQTMKNPGAVLVFEYMEK